MRTLIDMQSLMRKLLKETVVNTKKGTVITAIKTHVNLKRRQRLVSLIGNYEFGYAAQELEKMRTDRVEQLTSQLQAVEITEDRYKEDT